MASSPAWGDPPPSLAGQSTQPRSPSKLGPDQFPPDATDARAKILSAQSNQRRRMGFISTESWSLDSILARSDNFRKVSRISVASQSALLAAIDHHEATGIPLIVEGLHMLEAWNKDLFNLDAFCELIGPEKGRRSSEAALSHINTKAVQCRGERKECPQLERYDPPFVATGYTVEINAPYNSPRWYVSSSSICRWRFSRVNHARDEARLLTFCETQKKCVYMARMLNARSCGTSGFTNKASCLAVFSRKALITCCKR
jgi:hypothetical protein